MKYDELLEVNNIKLTKQYIQSLTKEQRLELIEPIFKILRESGFVYPDWDEEYLRSEYERLCDVKLDIDCLELYNNSSIATDVCKYFCKNFYLSTEKGKKNIIDVFNDDDLLKRTIKNRLGIDWIDADERGPGINEAFHLTYKMLCFQGPRSQRLVPAISMFKPEIAKYVCERYSQPGDVVGDYSCGWGGRMLGAMSCGRKYIGTDPLTAQPELQNMADFFGFSKENCKLIKSGSEDYRGEENSVDLYWSSPPYVNEKKNKKTEVQEWYSDDYSQAYAKGNEYFFNIYWKQTLENVKFMLKPGKYFGLNITEKHEKMISMAKEYFGEPIEIIRLRTIRSHLSKTAGIEKFEPIFMFKNEK